MTNNTKDALWIRLADLVPKMEDLVAASPTDFGITNHCLTRDGRWLYTVDASYEQVTIEQVADDVGLAKLVEELVGKPTQEQKTSEYYARVQVKPKVKPRGHQ